MASKRPAPAVHPSRRGQVPEDATRKKQKVNPTPHSQPKAHPVNPLKSRIRSLQRLLGHNDALPADVRLGHERELQSLQWELQQALAEQRRKDMTARYHKVRFFDRQKAAKRLRKAQKMLKLCEEGDDGRKAMLTAKAHHHDVNLHYALSFPLDRPYVALFPTRSKGGAVGEQDGQREEPANGTEVAPLGDSTMWHLVERCMVDGTLDALRDGRISVGQPDAADVALAAPVKAKESKPKPNGAKPAKAPDAPIHGTRRERRAAKAAAAAQNDDDDSDGGFFE